jgi:hypothetical protein
MPDGTGVGRRRHRPSAAEPAPDPTRSSLGRLGASARWSREDPRDPDGPLPRARAAFDARFVRQVDPDGLLDPAERARRIGHARRAYFIRLGLLSAAARRARTEAARGDAGGAS